MSKYALSHILGLLIILPFLVNAQHVLQKPASAPLAFNMMNFGATGNGRTDDAAGIQKAIDACWAAGGGAVFVPAGHIFLCGPVTLRSGIRLHIEGGAKLLANLDERVYRRSAFPNNPGEGMMWISGDNLEQVEITGKGTIDGNGVSFMGKELEDSYELKPFRLIDRRPHILTLVNSKHIRIDEITLTNSAYWTVYLAGCTDVKINHIRIYNNLKIRNSDGIDVDHSRDISISDCVIKSGDDCICIKNRREYAELGPCKNIKVINCTMTSRYCAFKIGSENTDSIKNVTVAHCTIVNSNRGLGIQNRDEGTISHIRFQDIMVQGHFFSDTWWGKAEPIYVTTYPRAPVKNKDGGYRFRPGQTTGEVGAVSDVQFNNIRCTSENGIYVGGDTREKISKISFERISLLITKTTTIPGGVFDRRPCEVSGLLQAPTSGFYLHTASDITIGNSSISWGANPPIHYTNVLHSFHVNRLRIKKLSGLSAHPGQYRQSFNINKKIYE